MNRTKQLRLARGLTQVEAAELAGIEQKRWSEVERRESLGDTSYRTIVAVAGALGVEPSELTPDHYQLH